MRRVQIFSGSSHPALAEAICKALGTSPAKIELRKFANGETSVNIGCSIRNQDVFVVQSGSSTINDAIMELLIILQACKGGSANKITAVLPYFPYSRQSKRKGHRGAITARMIANLLSVAGVHHIITVDLHASQMQGFFGKPVDNLHAEPLIARWIRHHVPNWKDAVVVSKNPGGTKRVTSLADALKLNFGIVTTDKRRGQQNLGTSVMFNGLDGRYDRADEVLAPDDGHLGTEAEDTKTETGQETETEMNGSKNPHQKHSDNLVSSPLTNSTNADDSPVPDLSELRRAQTVPLANPRSSVDIDYTDERARDVITGRLIHGHIVDDDHPSPSISAMSSSFHLSGQSQVDDPLQDSMTMSRESSFFSRPEVDDHALGGFTDGVAESDDEEPGPQLTEPEQMVTLVGNVRDRPVLIVDDMIDKCGSWIAAAETVALRGGANKVYCIATHGLFGDDSLERLEECEYIDYIVITNTFPIPPEKAKKTRKLIVLDTSGLLSEAIRRNHYGESISALFQHFMD